MTKAPKQIAQRPGGKNIAPRTQKRAASEPQHPAQISELPITAPMTQMPPGLQQMLINAAKPPPQRVYVSFSAEINPNTTESLIALIANQVNQGVKEIYLMLSTPGGTVMNGLNIYNFLRALPVKIITHNVGNVDSIGNAIFLAGEERFACFHSTFMFHGVGFDVPSGSRFEEKILRERLLSILADQKRVGSILGERTKLKLSQIRSLFKEARTKDADYARSVGIVHEIRDATIPEGAPIFSLVFQR